MNVDLEKLNRFARANEEKLRNTKNSDVDGVAACNAVRHSLLKIATEAGLRRSFDGTFYRPLPRV